MDIFNTYSNSIALFAVWLFFGAGASKLTPKNTAYYRNILEGYGIRSAKLATTLAVFLGAFELCSGIFAVIPQTRILGLTLCTAILTGYFTVFAVQLSQGKRDLDCGCAGPSTNVTLSPWLLLRNATLIILIGSAIPADPAAAPTAVWLVAMPFAFVLVLIYLSFEHLLVNAPKLLIHGQISRRGTQ